MFTFDVVGVVNDKVVVPHHRQIHWQVADVVALVGVLKRGRKKVTLKLF